MALSRVEVKITGEWASERPWNWHGVAEAAEPITALVLLNVGEHTYWARPKRRKTNALPIRLYIGRYDQAWVDVQVVWGIGANRRARTQLTIPPKAFPLTLLAATADCPF